jgi:hypothetical protein
MPLLEWLGSIRQCEADASGCQGIVAWLCSRCQLNVVVAQRSTEKRHKRLYDPIELVGAALVPDPVDDDDASMDHGLPLLSIKSRQRVRSVGARSGRGNQRAGSAAMAAPT